MRGESLRTGAHRLVECGYSLLPLRWGAKTPLVRWKKYESGHEEIERWLSRFGRPNIAIHTGRSGIIGLDADTPEAVRWIEENCPATPMLAATPRGGLHAYYRAVEETLPMVDLFGIGLDVRAGRSILVASPSWSREHKRRWEWRGEVVPASELPELPAELLPRKPEQPAPRPPPQSGSPRSVGHIRDVTRWIMRVESIQGRNGSGQCFRVACRLADSGMGWDEAIAWLQVWNERCAEPPWSEKELRHKLDGAFKRFC